MELLEGEVFKEVPDYELYQVSNYGRVKALAKTVIAGMYHAPRLCPERIMPLTNTKWGYKRVQFSKEGKPKSFLVHVLVCALFIDKPDWADVIDHIDGNPINNHVSNLRYCVHRENSTFENVKRIKPRKSIYRGVSVSKNGRRFFSKIYYDGKAHCLGYYGTELEAHNAYETAFAERVKISKSLSK